MKLSAKIIHVSAAALLLLVGVLLVVDLLPLPEISFVVGLGSAVVGLILLAVPFGAVRRIGFISLILGTYVTLREADIVQLDYVRYGLGIVLIAAGLIGVLRDLKGGDLEPVQPKEQE